MNRSKFIKEIKKLGFKRNRNYIKKLIDKYGKDNIPGQRYVTNDKSIMSSYKSFMSIEYEILLTTIPVIYNEKIVDENKVSVFKKCDLSQSYYISNFDKIFKIPFSDELYEVDLNEIKDKKYYDISIMRNNKIKYILK